MAASTGPAAAAASANRRADPTVEPQGNRQPAVARQINDAYAELVARHPKRFKAFASIPMDAPDAALAELHRALDHLKLNGVILLSNIRGRALTAPDYRPFFEEANRRRLCILLHPMLPANAPSLPRKVP